MRAAKAAQSNAQPESSAAVTRRDSVRLPRRCALLVFSQRISWVWLAWPNRERQRDSAKTPQPQKALTRGVLYIVNRAHDRPPPDEPNCVLDAPPVPETCLEFPSLQT